MKPLLASLFLVLAAALAGAAGKSPRFSISFHAEGDEFEGERMVRPEVLHEKQRWFRIAPVLTSKNFKAFHPFPSEDGASYGAAFLLDDRGWDLLMDAATVDSGKLMRVWANGRPIDTQRIAKPRQDDHMIVVWRGLTADEIKTLRGMMPEMSSESGEPEKKRGIRALLGGKKKSGD
jgi:hypothetical protein